MVRYHNFDVVFAEIPGETTLALNITGCPNRCPGCHSPHLQADEGRVLDEAELLGLLARYGRSVTCVAFMGGDAGPHKIARLAGTVRKTCPELRTAWYSGREELPEGFEAAAFDYVKLGGWVEALGPLTAPTTNQRLYRVGPDGTMEDITKLFHGLRLLGTGKNNILLRESLPEKVFILILHLIFFIYQDPVWFVCLSQFCQKFLLPGKIPAASIQYQKSHIYSLPPLSGFFHPLATKGGIIVHPRCVDPQNRPYRQKFHSFFYRVRSSSFFL